MFGINNFSFLVEISVFEEKIYNSIQYLSTDMVLTNISESERSTFLIDCTFVDLLSACAQISCLQSENIAFIDIKNWKKNLL